MGTIKRAKNKRNKSHKRGFTLIEVLVSLMVIGVALIAIIASIIYIRQFNEFTYEFVSAVKILHYFLEQARVVADTVEKFPQDFVAAFPPDTPLPLGDHFDNLPEQRVTVHYEDAEADPLSLLVRIEWRGIKGYQDIGISTIMTQREVT